MATSDPIRVCLDEELASGEVRVLALSPGADGLPREALVLRDAGGVIRAYLNRCQHLPVPLDGGSRSFLSSSRRHLQCGTHGALYRLDDGRCIAGPCKGTRLTTLSVGVKAGVVLLDRPE